MTTLPGDKGLRGQFGFQALTALQTSAVRGALQALRHLLSEEHSCEVTQRPSWGAQDEPKSLNPRGTVGSQWEEGDPLVLSNVTGHE